MITFKNSRYLAYSLRSNNLCFVTLLPQSEVVDNAVKYFSEVAIVYEAMFLADRNRIAEVDLATELSFAEYFNLMVDVNKLMFYKEMFPTGAGATALQSISRLTTLLISHVDKSLAKQKTAMLLLLVNECEVRDFQPAAADSCQSRLGL